MFCDSVHDGPTAPQLHLWWRSAARRPLLLREILSCPAAGGAARGGDEAPAQVKEGNAISPNAICSRYHDDPDKDSCCAPHMEREAVARNPLDDREPRVYCIYCVYNMRGVECEYCEPPKRLTSRLIADPLNGAIYVCRRKECQDRVFFRTAHEEDWCMRIDASPAR